MLKYTMGGERINLGLSFASFGQAKEDWSYMPVNSNIGFIFTEACNSQDAINRAIAHELGHGAFHLWHTFSTENKYVASQGTTNNLMDYSNNATSTDLYKYQWDYIHNPEFVVFRGDDEESEYFDFYFYDYFFRQIHSELSSFADGVKSTVAGWFKSQKKEEKPVIPELSDDQKAIIEILKGIHDAEMSYTIRQLGIIYNGEVDIEGHKCQIALHIQPDLEFRLAVNGPVTMTKKAFTREEHETYTLFSFRQSTDDKKIALAIQVDKDNADWLMKYLGGYEYNPDEIAIYITRTNTGEHSTTGTLVTNDGTISGYTVELPRGTDEQCMTVCDDGSIPYDCYCIMEGEYEFVINTKVYDELKKQYLTNNSLRIKSAVANGREGILVHKGSDDAKGWAQGCILPMPKKPIDNCKYREFSSPPRIDSKDSHQFVIDICNWVRNREVEIKKRYPNVKNITHKIVITKAF